MTNFKRFFKLVFVFLLAVQLETAALAYLLHSLALPATSEGRCVLTVIALLVALVVSAWWAAETAEEDEEERKCVRRGY